MLRLNSRKKMMKENNCRFLDEGAPKTLLKRCAMTARFLHGLHLVANKAGTQADVALSAYGTNEIFTNQ